ncbi:uncharacterized protein K452DRAFT_250025 [Aplosporella prunicola CBS 121167]|uniref:Peroxisomal ATPase PEX1 n=1 Tax=Aplosporella prunicola CBS 121167 TaxID=1176127 RepID=A0A6A6BH24_9PEZI|nr:uncharacterized protein K452DRAFT_250025 [Aplosporella prunicola CBS 121167]KAF2142177.1 hypothetical protein K452DRAFT_250025 [Aplosporella prunicola CBS 121167]
MAPPPRKPAAQAELSLFPSLKNCLVNLPASLVTVLVNADTIAQNVVVELTYRQAAPSSSPKANGPTNLQKSVFVGWTGMQAKRKLAPVVGRDGIAGSRGSAVGRDQDVAVVELDAAFGRLLGLEDGQKVGVLLHLDPPQAHTINIEPLTPADWEMIELHAQFLELNFLSQVRALPNPAFTPTPEAAAQPPHPITLHLSPTSTANITVTSLTPAPASSSPFIKISPDAEVIVASKTRQRPGRGDERESRSVASTSRKSQGGKSSASTVRRGSKREDTSSRGAIFLRGVDRSLGGDWFDDDESIQNGGLKVWVDRDILLAKAMRGVTWVYVSIVKPTGLQEPVDPQKDAETVKPPTKIVAKLDVWEDAPDSHHMALSSALCAALGADGLLGGLVRIEAAPPQVGKSKASGFKALKISPFGMTSTAQHTGLRFGGESKQEREEAARNIQDYYSKDIVNSLLDGPLTDGMILPVTADGDLGWNGGILRFETDSPLNSSPETTRLQPSWLVGAERKGIAIKVDVETSRPASALQSWSPGEALPASVPALVGIDPLIDQLMSHLTHSSSVLLTGGLGAGKTNLAHLLAHRLRTEYLYHTSYFPCRSLVTDETRVSTIKETMGRLFAAASWGARLGGHAIVILDDLDKLCPVETELQVGGENGRSRHISECLQSIVRQYCTMDSRVVLLATGQGKEAINNVIIGGHVVREIVSLKAPNKDGRRKVLEKLVNEEDEQSNSAPQVDGNGAQSSPKADGNPWMDGSSNDSRPSTSSKNKQKEGFSVDPTIDFLDLAGQTDGYMPGDLVLLVSRAWSEALIRSISAESAADTVTLTMEDFSRTLVGFTPASLRNVTLQSSTTKWDSIGGLHATRQTLLETLQYPTTYAPIFAQCPLRLRSGLLLYGYPGCGKTLLASAVAGECGLNFISVKGPEILNKYIGASEKSVRDLFERAEAAKPCVLFFDEFDSIAPKRGHDSTGVTDRVVNQLLTQMDGAEGLSGVYILAATSRPDLIDPALLRPGRLDKSLICDMPNLEERIDVLRAVTRKLRIAPDVLTDGDEGENLREIARRTEGYSGADLQAVAYNAQLEAIHDVLGDAELDMEDGPGAVAKKGNGKNKTNGVNGPTTGRKEGKGSSTDFMHFRFGDDTEVDGEIASPVALGERARIATQIQEMQALRRKQKQAQHEHSGRQGQHVADAEAEAAKDAAEGSKEPVIEWRHVLNSLQATRSSISEQERRRLAGIYREFLVGRNGEMPNGQGGTEIGGRTSLM